MKNAIPYNVKMRYEGFAEGLDERGNILLTHEDGSIQAYLRISEENCWLSVSYMVEEQPSLTVSIVHSTDAELTLHIQKEFANTWVAVKMFLDIKLNKDRTIPAPSFFEVDVPTTKTITLGVEGPWSNVFVGRSKEEAVKWIRDNIGNCDDEGRISLITECD